ncbi:MAG: hypothetical protein WA441_04605 [Methyloceanibacter sp.]
MLMFLFWTGVLAFALSKSEQASIIRAAVMEVGHNYRQVANWLTRRIPPQRDGPWAAQSVKNLVERYRRLTGKRLLVPYKTFPTPARRKDAPPEIPVVPWEDRRPGYECA